MQAKRINNWLNASELKSSLKDQNILDWLNEDGSITARISSKAKFKLEVLNDDLDVAEDEEYVALNIVPEDVRITWANLTLIELPTCRVNIIQKFLDAKLM